MHATKQPEEVLINKVFSPTQLILSLSYSPSAPNKQLNKRELSFFFHCFLSHQEDIPIMEETAVFFFFLKFLFTLSSPPPSYIFKRVHVVSVCGAAGNCPTVFLLDLLLIF